MSKKNRRSFEICYLVLLFLFIVSYAYAESFDPVFKVINRYQNGEQIDVRGHCDANSFSFFYSRETTINEKTYKEILNNKASQPIEQIEVLNDGKIAVNYAVNNLLYLKEIWSGDKLVSFKKIEFVQIESYPMKEWVNFIKQAVSKGLMEFQAIELDEGSAISLTFKQTGIANFRSGNRLLKFSDEFYKYFKVSKEFIPRTSQTDKIVVLVHEPHWLLIGQYELIPALRAFIDDNSQHQFKFLVEGYFESHLKDIPVQPTLAQFSKGISKNIQVYSLVNRFLIDGPLAYRLLYNPNIPAESIDAPELILKTPRSPDFEDWFESNKVLGKIYNEIKTLPKGKTNNILTTVNLLYIYTNANNKNLKGQSAIDYFRYVGKLYNQLSDELKSFFNLKEEQAFMVRLSRYCNTNVKIYEYALKRDAIMAENIINHFKLNPTDRIPLAFIGNFHTSGIINRLPKDISYIVIEPRISTASVIPPKNDMDNFNDALNSESRANYIKRIGASLKLRVAPKDEELPYYKSFLNKVSVRYIANCNKFMASSPLDIDTNSSLLNTFEQNGSLSNVNLSFAGGGQIPPPPFNGAFASISHGPEEIGPRMIFYDKKTDNWKRADRHNYLKYLLLVPIWEKYKTNIKQVAFYQDSMSKRMFFHIFDPGTQAFYLYEWLDGLDINKLLAPPKKDAQIHYKLSVIEVKNKKENSNG